MDVGGVHVDGRGSSEDADASTVHAEVSAALAESGRGRDEGAAVSSSRLASLGPGWSMTVRVCTVAFALYFVQATFVTNAVHVRLAVYVGATIALIFLLYPARSTSPRHRPSLVDLLWVAMALAPTVAFLRDWEAMLLRYGQVTDAELVYGALLALAALEACRRVLGWTLPVLALLMVAYAYFGPYLPEMFAHRGFGMRRLLGQIYSSNGIYGIVARTFADYVVIFVVFGAFLERTGAGSAFIKLALAAVGRSPGGAGKAAVVSSGLTGSFLGAGAANITVTGIFTIPLMKRTGFSAPKAAAIETVSSIGGHLVPPVMGAAVFLMASFTGIPYANIIAVAVVPALLLYATLYASVAFHSRRLALKAVSDLDGEPIPTFLETLRREGILLLPLVVLIALIFRGMSPFRAAGFAIVATLVVGWIHGRVAGGPQLQVRDAFDALSSGAVQTLGVGVTAGVMGILLAALFLPGTTLLLSGWVVNLSGGRMFIAILLVLVTSYVLGMGMTITASYVIIAVVAAPVLIDLGIPLLVAHLVVIWFSQDSSFTPPFALGAWIAAGIAKADPQKTAWKSVAFGKPIYIIPILMIYTPILALDGYTPEVLFSIGTALVGLILLAATAEQYWYQRFRAWETPMFIGAALLLFVPSYALGALGLVIAAALVGQQRARLRTAERQDAISV